MISKWPCTYKATATKMDGNNIYISGPFDGFNDIVGNAETTLRKRLRKPWQWYGVGITLLTPLGQAVECIIECNDNGQLILQGI